MTAIQGICQRCRKYSTLLFTTLDGKPARVCTDCYKEINLLRQMLETKEVKK